MCMSVLGCVQRDLILVVTTLNKTKNCTPTKYWTATTDEKETQNHCKPNTMLGIRMHIM